MAFTPGTIAGETGANSFASIQQITDYWADRGVADWAPGKDETTKQGYAVLATDWIVRRFQDEWRGMKAFAEAGLPWPRVGIVSNGEALYPNAVIYATAELAKLAASGISLINVTGDPAKPQVIERTIGPITTKFAALSYEAVEASRSFDFVADILRAVLTFSGAAVKTVRV